MNYFNKLSNFMHRATQFKKAILYNSKKIKIAEYKYDGRTINLEALNPSIKSLGSNDGCYFVVKSYLLDDFYGEDVEVPFSFVVKTPKTPLIIKPDYYVLKKIMKLPVAENSKYFPSNPNEDPADKRNWKNIADVYNGFCAALYHISKHPFS